MTGYTEHGTRDAGQDAARLPLRAGAFDGRPAVGAVEGGTQDAERPAVHPADQEDTSQVNGTEQATGRGPLARFNRWRATRARTAEEQAAEERAARQRRDAERDAEQARIAERQAAATRAAVRRRHATRTGSEVTREDEIAPVPVAMQWIGVWLGRTFGALPLVAPLIVSGYFTVQVFTDKPITAPFIIALLVTLALEGGLFKLAKLYEATLLEGDSTIGIRVGIGVYLGLISGLIYWHAQHLAATAQNVKLTEAAIGWGWLPAAGTAAFSALGVFIWGKDARYRHRVRLREQEKIDKQAPKFSVLSWLLCPWETPWAFRHAVKHRLERPVDAVNDYRLWKAAGKPRIWPELGEADTGAYSGHPATVLTDGAITGNAGRPAGRTQEDALPTRTARTVPAPAQRPALPAGTAADPYRTVPQDTAGHGMGPDADGAAVHHGTDTADTVRTAGDPEDVPLEDGTGDGWLLSFAPHILAITEAYPDWQRELPSVRKAKAAIDADWRRRGTAKGFNSTSTTQRVLDVMRGLADAPGIAEQLDKLRQPAADN